MRRIPHEEMGTRRWRVVRLDGGSSQRCRAVPAFGLNLGVWRVAEEGVGSD